MIIREELQLSYGEIIPSGKYGLLNSPLVDSYDWSNNMLWIQFSFPLVGSTVTPPTGATSMIVILNAHGPASRVQNNQLSSIPYILKTIDFTGPAPFDIFFSFGGKSNILSGCVFYEYQITLFNNVGADITVKSVSVTKSNSIPDK